jgi:sigma-B regulation protein RsbU (phosphoserine phosphatase)
MANLPPVHLGASIITAFAAVFVLRLFLQKRFVESKVVAGEIKTRRQFLLDLGLCLGAGILVVIFNRFQYGFYWASGLTLLLGCFTMGIFLALDMGLARERNIIADGLERGATYEPPSKFYPLTRKFFLATVLTTLLVTLILLLVIARDFDWLISVEREAGAMLKARNAVAMEVVFILAVLMGMTINLVLSYSRNLKLLFQNETGVLNRVSKGDLSQMVPVVTSDEFGYIAGHTNNMIQGLRHRSQLLTSIKLAEEIQYHLLPSEAPRHPLLDIAGVSSYCDETGGDYFDYLPFGPDLIGILVADAADHGIGSALHMTTARAFLRYGAGLTDRLPDLVGAANAHLSRDFDATGRFMTLFLLKVDTHEKALTWIRAGHEKALLFDPEMDHIEELGGNGMALGISKEAVFAQYQRKGWTPGSIVLLITDGLRETRNANGEFYGRRRLIDELRAHASASADQICKAVLKSVNTFRGDGPKEDDTTLVVVKLL